MPEGVFAPPLNRVKKKNYGLMIKYYIGYMHIRTMSSDIVLFLAKKSDRFIVISYKF